jgi:sec-independent protein translocase protein TatC
MSFLDHLEVLRWHLVRSSAVIIVMAVVAFIFKDIIFDRIIFAPKESWFWTNRVFCAAGDWMNEFFAPIGLSFDPKVLCINQTPMEIYNINMSGQFSTHIRISMLAGLVLSFPYVFYELWRFIRPALRSTEAKHGRGAIFFSSLLFMLGVLFGYYLIIPLTVHFFSSYQISDFVANEINLTSYISTFSSVVFASGIIFELPVLVYFLAKIGLVSSAFLKKYRKHSIIVMLVLSAIITPPDVFSQLLVTIPLIVLYEISIVITKRIERKKFLESAETL